MSVMTAHRILIATAILFFAGYAAWEWAHGAGAAAPTVRAGVSAAVAIGLAFYLRSVWRKK